MSKGSKPKAPAKGIGKSTAKLAADGRRKPATKARGRGSVPAEAPADALAAGPAIMDRLWSTVVSRRSADPNKSHSARLLARGTAKVAQKFGEEAVECLIEAVAKNPAALVAESADVLYHLVVMWVAAGIEPAEVWAELHRREGVSGVAEKAARALGTTKIP